MQLSGRKSILNTEASSAVGNIFLSPIKSGGIGKGIDSVEFHLSHL